LDFKSFIISDLIKNEEFAEVLILGGLGRAMFANCSVFRLRDPPTPSAFAGATAGRGSAFPKRRNSQGTLVADKTAAESALGMRRSRLMPHDNMRGNAVSRLSLSYSNTVGLNFLSSKDFAATANDRPGGDFAGSLENFTCVPGFGSGSSLGANIWSACCLAMIYSRYILVTCIVVAFDARGKSWKLVLKDENVSRRRSEVGLRS
jgi:hypothetical protein